MTIVRVQNIPLIHLLQLIHIVLTLGDEIVYIWGGRPTRSRLLFYVVRMCSVKIERPRLTRGRQNRYWG